MKKVMVFVEKTINSWEEAVDAVLIEVNSHNLLQKHLLELYKDQEWVRAWEKVNED